MTVEERIHREGPIRFGAFVELALYGPDGFFTRGGGAGRAGQDFITSPETGSLFGACVAHALDAEWLRQGAPDPFVVVEAGAGNGRLAREVLRAEPACAPALHYVLVERSAALREEQANRLALEPLADALGPARRRDPEEEPEPVGGLGPIVSALDDVPARPVDGVILANELLDNLAFDIVERTDAGWSEVRVGLRPECGLEEVLIPAAPDLLAWVTDLDPPVGTRLPVATGAVEWIVRAGHSLHRGSLILLDYTATWSELAERSGAWLRTFSAHTKGSDPLASPGTRDITTDVPLEMVHRAAQRAGLTVTTETTQAEWLASLGIDRLVAGGRAAWEAAASAPDLAALAGRSRITESAALTDPAGLGAHTVIVLTKP